jgi:hypothetical protein
MQVYTLNLIFETKSLNRLRQGVDVALDSVFATSSCIGRSHSKRPWPSVTALQYLEQTYSTLNEQPENRETLSGDNQI